MITPLPSTLSQKERWKLKQKSRCTSWYNSNEFYHVGQCLQLATQLFNHHHNPNQESSSSQLLSSSTATTKGENVQHHHNLYNEINHGIQRVSIWRKRSNHNNNGRLPHSIDIICSLAESLLNDSFYSSSNQNSYNHNSSSSSSHNNSISISSSMSLRLAYASTIIRGVNGIADSISRNRSNIPYQQQQNNNTTTTMQTQSISTLCSKIGLPLWIVDLRHDASHQELPSLISLRLGCKVLLEYYMNYYWYTICDNRDKIWKKGWNEYLMNWIDDANVDDNGNGGNGNDNDIDEDGDNNTGDDEPQLEDNNANAKKEQKNSSNKQNKKSSSDTSTDTNYGAYSIFLHESNKEKQIKKKIREDITKKKQKKKQIKSTKKMELQRQELMTKKKELCVKEFLKNIPIDIGYDLLISFLVWGDGSSGSSGGLLIPDVKGTSSLSTVDYNYQSQESIQSLQEQFGQTLIAQVCKVWPGFITCLLVNLIDYIHLLEDETISSSTKKMSKAERDQKLYIAFSWVYYLTSDNFYFHLGWIKDHNEDKDKNSTSYLKLKAKNLKNRQLTSTVFESNSASLDILSNKARLPLNSLCDKCLDHIDTVIQQTRSHDTTMKVKTSMDIISLFEQILKDTRIEYNGIANCTHKRKVEFIDELKANRDEDGVNKCKKVKILQDNDPESKSLMVTNNDLNKTTTMMTLEDIESILDKEDDFDGKNPEPNATEKHDQANSDNKRDIDNTINNCDHQAHEKRTVKAWTLCPSWDSCAIGTLPGYVG